MLFVSLDSMDEINKRFKFLEIFQELPDGALSPKRQLEINGITISAGAVFQRGVAFGGIDFHLYKYSDIAAQELADGSLKFIGFYRASLQTRYPQKVKFLMLLMRSQLLSINYQNVSLP